MNNSENEIKQTPYPDGTADYAPLDAAPQDDASRRTQEPASSDQTAKEPDYIPPITEKDKVSPEKITDNSEIDDYVVPEHSFKDHMKGRATLHSGKTKIASTKEMHQAEEGFVFIAPPSDYDNRSGHHHHHHSSHSHHHHDSHSHHHHGSSSSSSSADNKPHSSDRKHHTHRKHHRHRRMPLWLKIIIIVVSVLLALVIAAAGTFLILREIGRKDLHTDEDFVILTPTEPSSHDEIFTVDNTGRTIVYEGKTYHFNEGIVTIAVIGVDHDIENNAVQSMGDSINIVAIDTATGKLSIISVSRDTMGDINLYSDEGNYIDTERLQMAYAYSFGNSHISGGKNTTDALTKLFFGLPVENYFAINMDALITLNDAIGGVTLTSSLEFYSPLDGRYIGAGDTVTLHGREVDYYVRRRDTSQLASNSDRMQRQKEYISAFLSQVIPMIKSDLSLVTDLYNIVNVNSESTMNLPKLTYLASTLASKLGSASEIEYLGLDGETVRGEFAEFIPNDKSILKTMLHVFYTPVE